MITTNNPKPAAIKVLKQIISKKADNFIGKSMENDNYIAVHYSEDLGRVYRTTRIYETLESAILAHPNTKVKYHYPIGFDWRRQNHKYD